MSLGNVAGSVMEDILDQLLVSFNSVPIIIAETCDDVQPFAMLSHTNHEILAVVGGR